MVSLPFSHQVYRLVKKVPRGRVTTYKAVAEALGTKAYQAVGQALRRNPNPKAIPCHRVVASEGSLGGFFGRKTKEALVKKKELLKKEGVEFEGLKIKNFEKLLFRFG